MSSGRDADDTSSGRGVDDMSSKTGADDMSSGRGVDDTSSGRGADDIFSMIEYIKSTRDDVWMIWHCLLVRKISRTTADNMHIIYICSDYMQMTCTYADEM